MTELYGLPDELLLAVVNCLRDDTNNRYRDLNRLALTCRKLRPIAQEVFYTDISTNPTLKRGLARLARTLLQRPDLANRVRKLSIKLTEGPITHFESCVSSGYYYEEDGEECTCDAALIRLILCITPVLSNLTLVTWDSPMYETHNNIAWAEVEEVFEDITRHKDLADCLQGLSSLTRLFTNGYPPCSWLSLPRLEAARINLFEDAYYDNTMISHIAPSTTVSTTLTRLIIQADFEALYSYDATHMKDVYGHIRSIVSGLTHLTHLFILYDTIVDPYGEFLPLNTPRGSCAHIVSHLESRSLTDLTLDIEPALKNLVRYMTLYEYIHDTTPMTTFAGLTRIGNLNVPQEAFFSANEKFGTCHLPATIESISIMNSTYETKRYLKHLPDHQTEWPNLKIVKLGEDPCNKQSRYPEESNDDDASESDEGERRKVFGVDNSMYEQARSRGLRVEKVQDRVAWKK
ncbi:hypothetical protein BKA58DRAFT_462803 [Alternaria rosae]|uniref:uncharacterized protein n=1 Tax=Alternaria rosae TaxID=1187941 RepID=UPI001E8EDD0B|nr:uncharacterized protein BKA58DRAFT_462803 [Alternaria rosae]KAH6865165.1 hypothetical protein BKA58DRAFT_462803 [Alternaria rosae]